MSDAATGPERLRLTFLRLAGAPNFTGREALPWHAPDMVQVLEGDHLQPGRMGWNAEIQGGHAPASLLLFSDCGAFVLTADQILVESGSFVRAPLDAPLNDSLVQQTRHLERLEKLLFDTIALPGHGIPLC